MYNNLYRMRWLLTFWGFLWSLSWLIFISEFHMEILQFMLKSYQFSPMFKPLQWSLEESGGHPVLTVFEERWSYQNRTLIWVVSSLRLLWEKLLWIYLWDSFHGHTSSFILDKYVMGRSFTGWTDTLWYLHLMEYYSEIKRNELLTLTVSWKNPKNT